MTQKAFEPLIRLDAVHRAWLVVAEPRADAYEPFDFEVWRDRAGG